MKAVLFLVTMSWLMFFSACAMPTEQSESTSNNETRLNEVSNSYTEQGVYFTCENIDTDIYLMNIGNISQKFLIFSLEPLNVEEVSIEIPIETDYVVSVAQLCDQQDILTTEYLDTKDDFETVSPNPYAFPYYLYQCYRGTDWGKMRELELALLEAEQEDPWNTTEEQEALSAYQNLYLEDYKAITKEDLPVFYVYSVDIWFALTDMSGNSENPKMVSEKFQNITIQIGEEAYVQDIGEIRLHAEPMPEDIISFQSASDNLKNFMGISSGKDTYPWGDGMMCETVQLFKALKDMTVTNLYLYESDLKVIGAHVTTSNKPLNNIPSIFDNESDDPSKETTVDFYWDLKSPFPVSEGTYVSIDLIFQEPRLTQMRYGGRIYPVMEYSVKDGSYTIQTELTLDRQDLYDVWLYYAISFGGLDMESYFNDYYHSINGSWKEDLPW